MVPAAFELLEVTQIHGRVNVRQPAIGRITINPAPGFDRLQQQAGRKGNQPDRRAQMILLKRVDDIVHGEKLIAGKPKDKTSLGHPLEGITASDRAAVR